jgi:hypothetical protein
LAERRGTRRRRLLQLIQVCWLVRPRRRWLPSARRPRCRSCPQRRWLPSARRLRRWRWRCAPRRAAPAAAAPEAEAAAARPGAGWLVSRAAGVARLLAGALRSGSSESQTCAEVKQRRTKKGHEDLTSRAEKCTVQLLIRGQKLDRHQQQQQQQQPQQQQ